MAKKRCHGASKFCKQQKLFGARARHCKGRKQSAFRRCMAGKK